MKELRIAACSTILVRKPLPDLHSVSIPSRPVALIHTADSQVIFLNHLSPAIAASLSIALPP